MKTATLSEKRFHDETEARRYLESLRWPDGPICPHCANTERISKLQGKGQRPGLYFCGKCRKQFTVTVGSVFERSHVPLTKWLLATHLMCSSKKGMSAHQLHRMLGVTYKTAWFMAHRIREAMKADQDRKLGGEGRPVEVDETYWGNVGKHRKGATGGDHKMKVVSLVERDGEKRSFPVKKVTGKNLRPILAAHIQRESHLMTDEHGAYYQLGKKDFDRHSTVNHGAKEYARPGGITTNTVESSFALLKRGLIGVFHHVSEQHLGRYTTEFDFRWNARKLDDVSRAIAALKGAEGKRLQYQA